MSASIPAVIKIFVAIAYIKQSIPKAAPNHFMGV
jgi:hypothetical protein